MNIRRYNKQTDGTVQFKIDFSLVSLYFRVIQLNRVEFKAIVVLPAILDGILPFSIALLRIPYIQQLVFSFSFAIRFNITLISI